MDVSTPLQIGPLTPNTRQRKNRVSINVFKTIKNEGIINMSKQDQVEILESVMRKMGIQDEFCKPAKPSKAGRKLTQHSTCVKVWEFWHSVSEVSTNTSRPAKLKQADKPKIQENLEFIHTVTLLENKRHMFYQSTWLTLSKTYKVLYLDFITNNLDDKIGYGTFLVLKPFYIRPVKKCDRDVLLQKTSPCQMVTKSLARVCI